MKNKHQILIEGVPGFGDALAQELKERAVPFRPLGEFEFVTDLPVIRLESLDLRCALNCFLYIHFEISRPKALLGDENFRTLSTALIEVAKRSGLRAFRIEAAGKDSSLMQRLSRELSAATSLNEIPTSLSSEAKEESAEAVVLRLRKSHASAWEVLIRLTRRPLSVRKYRRRDYVGAINGVAAACIARSLLSKVGTPSAIKVYDPAVGSGTMLIELMLMRSAQVSLGRGSSGRGSSGLGSAIAAGIDLSPEALSLARENAAAAGVELKLSEGDYTLAGDEERDFNLVISNLPWGERLGARGEARLHYQSLLSHLDKRTSPEASLALVTQDTLTLDKALSKSAKFELLEKRKYQQRGFHPTAYFLRKVRIKLETVLK